MVREINKLVKDSPQRSMKLEELRKAGANESKSVHAFCPTRWTVRGDTLAAVTNNHNELMELWEWSLAKLQDTEMKARVHGAVASMKKIFYLDAYWGHKF